MTGSTWLDLLEARRAAKEPRRRYFKQMPPEVEVTEEDIDAILIEIGFGNESSTTD